MQVFQNKTSVALPRNWRVTCGYYRLRMAAQSQTAAARAREAPMGCRERCCVGKGVTCGISNAPSYLGEMITADIIFSSREFGVYMTNKNHINSINLFSWCLFRWWISVSLLACWLSIMLPNHLGALGSTGLLKTSEKGLHILLRDFSLLCSQKSDCSMYTGISMSIKLINWLIN